MDHLSSQSTVGDGSLQIQIDMLNDNVIEPQREDHVDQLENRGRSNGEPGSSLRSPVNAPEKRLTLFALQLAVLEKMATLLGALGFIWATVVLLGGYAIKLQKTDFWFITIILIIEGARIFSRSHELEWQQQCTWTMADANVHSFNVLRSSSRIVVRAIKGMKGPISVSQSQELTEKIDEEMPSNRPSRTWTSSEVPLIPYSGWFSLSRNISRLLYWLQFLSASVCITLSVVGLVLLSCVEKIESSGDTKNEKSAVIIFYGLAFAEAFLSLLEKLYWEWTITFRRLLEEVNKDCDLGSSGMIAIKRFFYDAYSDCINGSIFDGLKLDLVTFATELLASHSSDEQLIGARILRKFSTDSRFSDYTLRKIGTSISVVERLVEMLNWKNPQETEIREAAAVIVSKLAGKKQNSLRVAGIPGAMESISSLLHTTPSFDGPSLEIGKKGMDQPNYEFSVFNRWGLTILKKLARDRGNCEKIGSTRGLLPKIINFTYTGESLLKDSQNRDSDILIVKKSLQVLGLLAKTTGTVGKHLRREIGEIVFTVSNIRETLKYGEKYPKLQLLGIEILTSMALDEVAKERIGSTGGIFKELFRIFFQEQNPEDKHKVNATAGKAIAKLAQPSKKNCSRILNQNQLTKLVGALEDPVLQVNSARILRNVCTYAGQDCDDKLKDVCAAAPKVLKVITSEEKDKKLQEVMLGLAAQVFRFREARNAFQQTGIGEAILAVKLVKILKSSQHPSSEVPRMRRFVVELAISLMEKNTEMVQTFRVYEMKEELEKLSETTSEVESFDIFDGIIGLNQHRTAQQFIHWWKMHSSCWQMAKI